MHSWLHTNQKNVKEAAEWEEARALAAQEWQQILLKGWVKGGRSRTAQNIDSAVLNHSHRRWPLEARVRPRLFQKAALKKSRAAPHLFNHVVTRRALKTSQRATVNIDGVSLSSSGPLRVGHWARQRQRVGWKESLPAANWSRPPHCSGERSQGPSS